MLSILSCGSVLRTNRRKGKKCMESGSTKEGDTSTRWLDDVCTQIEAIGPCDPVFPYVIVGLHVRYVK